MDEKNHTIEEVDITISANMYGRLPDMRNEPSHVLAEFVDNALQSYFDNKVHLLEIEPDYKLQIVFDVEWDEISGRYNSIIIHDNAGGINEDKFKTAMKTAVTPIDNTGLNEFGMGLQTATLWLGEEWSLETSALGETEKRRVTFNLNNVVKGDLKKLPFIKEPDDANDHYTTIEISSPTHNAFSKKMSSKIREEIASIYRRYLRNKEISIIFDGVELDFNDLPILQAPFYKEPNGSSVIWRKEIDAHLGSKYRAHGFVGILRTMSDSQSGFVLLRRGRVIIGEGYNGRYKTKVLSGQFSSPRSKRLFGELELEGFDVAFNKNGIQDQENLDTLMELVRDEIHRPEFDMLAQAEKYRPDEKRTNIKKVVKRHDFESKRDDVVEREPKSENTKISTSSPALPFTPIEPIETVIDEYEDKYKIKGVTYSLIVQFVDNGKDLVRLDVSQKDSGKLICKINTSHPYITHFFPNFKLPDSVIALLKTIAIAKFSAREEGDDSASAMLDAINDYIKVIKI
jgi:hypothetical protein